MDNWRVGKGATMYYPVAVPGGLFSVGDSHAAQGDSELCGTAIEMSLTGTFQLNLHKQNTLSGSLAGLNYPLLETQDEWVMHGFSFANYLEELGPTAQQGCVPQDAQFSDDHQVGRTIAERKAAKARHHHVERVEQLGRELHSVAERVSGGKIDAREILCLRPPSRPRAERIKDRYARRLEI
jgi:Acetamidase/Formamidase family